MKKFFNKKVMVLLAVGMVAIGSFSFAYPGRMGGYGSPFGTTGTPAFSGDFGREEGSGTWGPGYGMMGGSYPDNGSPAAPGYYGREFGSGYGMMGGYAGRPCHALGVNQASFNAVDTEEALQDYLDNARVELEVLDKITYDSGVRYVVVLPDGETQAIELIVNPADGFVRSPGSGGAYRGRAVQDPPFSELTVEEAERLAVEALETTGIEGVLIEGHAFKTFYTFYLEQEDEITQVIRVNKWNGFVRSDARFGTIERIEREEGDA